MDVDFESSSEEEEEAHDLSIVISEVCSVLDVDQVGRVVENPMFTADSDGDLSENVEGDIVKDTDYVYVKESPEEILTDLEENDRRTHISPPHRISKLITKLKSSVRSRSVSSCVDDAPNQGLHDDEVHSDDDDDDQEHLSDINGPVGSLVWAKMKGYPAWPAIIVPDPKTGRSKEMRKGKQGGEWRHVLFLEYRNEVAWLHEDQLKVFSIKELNMVKGKNKALRKAVELSSSLSNMTCMDRIRKFTEYQDMQNIAEEKRMCKGISVGQVWSKLSMTPVVRLKRVKMNLRPVVMVERIKVSESDSESDVSQYDTDDLLADSDEETRFTQIKSPSLPSSPGDSNEWCEGMLVWARVQGYPFWPAVIVREQKSEEFSIPSKTGLVRIHVMFLAFQKQTALVVETALVPFYSADQFKDLQSSGNQKSLKDLRPTKTLAPKYNLAVKTATELLPRSLYNRLEYLYT